VEKDMDNKEDIDAANSVSSQKSNRSSLGSMTQSLFGRKRANTGGSVGTPLGSVKEENELFDASPTGSRPRTVSQDSLAPGQNPKDMQGPDGAPLGYAYQAESPDEGALVMSASTDFGFQVVMRDSSGITLRSNFPSHLENETVAAGMQSGAISLKRIAAETANAQEESDSDNYNNINNDAGDYNNINNDADMSPGPCLRKDEKWAILAVNKFDSDRKRMSVLLRSPPELGSLPIVFCKGADSAMLEPGICSTRKLVSSGGLNPQGGEEMPTLERPAGIHDRGREVSALSTLSEDEVDEDDDIDEDGWEVAQMLGVQAHLGDFAREGLRTLVLGIRVLSEEDCEEWLKQYKSAAISLTNREELLTAAGKKLERDLHIVGATAIEDKLQSGVPHTISQMEKAGIKLWVLTGDKRETAVEIGYSTHVLTPKMHLTEVPDNGNKHVRTQMAMEFIRLVKIGKLREYQKAALSEEGPSTMKHRFGVFLFNFYKSYRATRRSMMTAFASMIGVLGMKERAEGVMGRVAESEAEEDDIVADIEKRRKTRTRAEKIIKEWIESEGGGNRNSKQIGASHSEDDLSLASEETPGVFNRATSARLLLNEMRSSGSMNQPEFRRLSLAHLTVQQAQSGEEEPLVDEDTLSLESFMPVGGGVTNDFDKKKRTILERLFAADREVRKGRLKRHMSKSKLASITENLNKSTKSLQPGSMTTGPRALVIEGDALKYLLGDPDLEGILFAVASQCDAVIACRVTPKQKALLVNLVRRNVTPEPVTLAIGDGANDVGMIQEAHVGVGISGKEGKQAVNASDFAISQFRFLEELILIHGRWGFFRLSTVVLFSFYKNAVMAGTLVVYAEQTLYSGTPLYDEWIIAMLNFVAAFPILFLGLFDRCLSKKYVKEHPEVFKATRDNELITLRTIVRWVVLVFVHIFTLYYLTVPQQSHGGGITSSWDGLMSNSDRDVPGNGEAGDLKSVGTVTYTALILMLAYKVSWCCLHSMLSSMNDGSYSCSNSFC
jgi:magnesium-transporting ATPase (P-type)